MNESLYLEYIQKYFPMLVTSVIERLNEKRQNALPYIFKQVLTPAYSNDCRWASIIAEYTRVAADVVSLDSELPLKSRDSLEVAHGEIPKMGMKLYMTEKQMKDLDSMIAQNMPVNRILQNMFADLPRCIEGVWERIEDIFLSELSTGVGIDTRGGSTGVRINVGYYEDHQFGVTTVWQGNAKTALAVDDLQKVFDKALEDQNVITDMWADDYFLRALYSNEQFKQQFAFDQGFVGQNIPNLDFDKAAQVVATKWGVTLHRVARKVKTELNGKKMNHNPWQEGVCAFTCDEMLGDLVWTTCAEATRPVNAVEYQTADEYILLSRYSTNDPLREFTSSQAMVVPVINNVDRIYTLDSKKVQA